MDKKRTLDKEAIVAYTELFFFSRDMGIENMVMLMIRARYKILTLFL